MRTVIGAMVLIVVFAALGTVVSLADSPHDMDMKPVLQDFRGHAGERHRAYGPLYSNTAAWNLAYPTGEPSNSYTPDGARAELTGPGARELEAGDIFAGTVIITGRSGSADPEVTVEDIQVVGHQR